MTRAANPGSRVSVSVSHAATREGRVSGGCAGRSDSGGRRSASGIEETTVDGIRGRRTLARDDYTGERRKSTTISTWSRDEQHRRVADAGEFDDARPWAALAHRARRGARQQIGLRAAQHERRTA